MYVYLSYFFKYLNNYIRTRYR